MSVQVTITIEVVEGLPLLVSSRRQEAVAGVAVEDTRFLVVRHGGWRG